MVWLGSPVPTNTTPALLMGTSPAASASVGALGSTLTVNEVDCPGPTPDCVVVKVCLPSASGAVVNEKWPLLEGVTVPTSTPSTKIWIVLPGNPPTPLNVTVLPFCGWPTTVLTSVIVSDIATPSSA